MRAVREIMEELYGTRLTLEQQVLIGELIMSASRNASPLSGAERAKRFRARRNESNESNDVVTVVTLKEAPHTPQENIYNYIHAKEDQKPPPSEGPLPSKPQKKGSRLPPGWKPSPESVEYAEKLGFSATEIEAAAEDMRLWAASASGQVAVKRDWECAFKGWMRREKAKKPTSSQPYSRGNWGNNVTPITGKLNVFAPSPPKPNLTPEQKAELDAKLAQVKARLCQGRP